MIDSGKEVIQKIRMGILSHYPLIYIVGWEENRLETLLSHLASELYREEDHLITWTSSRGFSDTNEGQDLLQALIRIRQEEHSCIFLMKDLPAHFADNPTVIRAVRDLYYELKSRDIFVFLSHPVLHLPDVLNKEIFLVRMRLPSENEIKRHLLTSIEQKGLTGKLSEEEIHRLAVALVGLSLNETSHLFTLIFHEQSIDLEHALHEVYEEKSQILEKESCLRYVPPDYSLGDIGGLGNLKEWVLKRKLLFTEKAFKAGIPLPSGILLMGVSGCGKSMAAKTIAAAWEVPLVKLDMSLVLSGSYGSPEAAFEHATRIAEQIAPVVLWIDELENSFGYDEKALGHGNINIFSSFLSWMQDKPSNVFLAATANRIQLLPAELIRKGRFDQTFFLDLPTKEERAEILRIHIERQGGTPEEFDLGYLSAATKEWNGAELEQAVIAARVDAYQEDRGFTEQDVARNAAHMVPLSKTMKEQIKAIKDWTFQRAVPASSSKD
jgi:ATP-dependent 26S proteasome regulatory subunit